MLDRCILACQLDGGITSDQVGIDELAEDARVKLVDSMECALVRNNKGLAIRANTVSSHHALVLENGLEVIIFNVLHLGDEFVRE